MTAIYQTFLKLAESLNGIKIEGQFAKDIIWLIAALFGFWFLVLLALTPYWLLRWMFKKK